ncbi:MAG: mucoidy inhibitor MuiA family protein [Planctomycetes bacterium]|nr:mucoidy inhibitor MuiA family protein [Planctomycetota bacterium]
MPFRFSILLSLGCLFLGPAMLLGEPALPEASLPIAAVTVYEDRALARRTGEVEVRPGINTIRVVGLPVGLVETSLQASLPGEVRAKVLSVTTRTEERLETQDERLRALEKEEDGLNRVLREIAARGAVLADQERYLGAFEQVLQNGLSERTTLGSVKAEELKEAGEFLAVRRAAASEERRRIQVEQEDAAEKLEEVRKRIAQIETPARKTIRYADVVLESAGDGKVPLSVSYLIGDAWWRPRYEARLAGGRLEVSYMGEVRQGTGEDWNSVELVLSTARPSFGSARPTLAALALDLAEETPARTVASFAATGPMAEAPASPAPEVGEGEPGPPPEAPPPPPEEVTVQESGTSVAFQVPGRSSIPSDRRAHKLPVMTFRDDAPVLGLETTPKALRYVYLRGKTVNRTNFPMLPGPVDIFRESGFMGTASLPFVAPGKNVEFSFGIDEEIKVQRRADPERTRVNVSGRRKEHRYAFDTEVANYKAEKQAVLVLDNLPVSDVEEVTVRLDASTTTPAKQDEKQGRLEWLLELQPGEKKMLHLEYGVTMPKDFTWEALGDNVSAQPMR